MKVAISRVNDSIAPRFEHSTTITIYTIVDRNVVEEVDFTLQSEEALDRIRLLRDQAVDTLICGGVQQVVENILVASGINAITWVTGKVGDLLDLYLRGRLVAGSGRPGSSGP